MNANERAIQLYDNGYTYKKVDSYHHWLKDDILIVAETSYAIATKQAWKHYSRIATQEMLEELSKEWQESLELETETVSESVADKGALETEKLSLS